MAIFILSFLLFLSIFAATATTVLYFRANLLTQKAEKHAEECEADARKFEEAYLKIKNAPKVVLENAKAEAKRLVDQASELALQTVSSAETKAQALIQNAEQHSSTTITEAEAKAKGLVQNAELFSTSTVSQAEVKARTLVQNAEEESNAKVAKANAQLHKLNAQVENLEKAATAINNRINGYGDEYLIPIESVIDELAHELGYSEPGKKLQETKKEIRTAIRNGTAATSKILYLDKKEKAVEFILDAFLGKAETILGKVKSDNFGKLKQELIDSFHLVNLNGTAFETEITKGFLALYQDKLKWASILQKMKKDQQEEQRQLRERLREEAKVRKEAEKAQKEALREEEAVQKALAVAYEKMAKASEEEKANYEKQITELNQRVAEAEAKRERAISMAQQTKMGHVYVISNIGSLGEDVFKIGLTRRLEPQDRIDELGDSSVPFEFDVHALIKSEDAPALEHKLHKHFLLNQVNKVNHRKEFFKVPLAQIREEIEKMGLEATWTMTAAALEYKESLIIEKLIASDPNAREKWISRQLELDDKDLESGVPTDLGDEEDED